MFWFSSKPPIDAEYCMWMQNCFEDFQNNYIDRERFHHIEMILPTDSYFPDKYDLTYESLKKIFNRICYYMSVDPDEIELDLHRDIVEETEKSLREILPSWSKTGDKNNAIAAGYYNETCLNKPIISIKQSMLTNPMALIATISHEVSHHIMLNKSKIPRKINLMEQKTDLFNIFLGMGIFVANSSIQYHQWSNSQKEEWSIRGIGYLPQEIIGFALAQWVIIRGESDPAWTMYLSANLKAYFRQSLRYIKSNSRR